MIHRIKSPVKFAEKLTKITSTIKGLVQLSYRHNIKNKLRDSDISNNWRRKINQISHKYIWSGFRMRSSLGKTAFLEKDPNNKKS